MLDAIMVFFLVLIYKIVKGIINNKHLRISFVFCMHHKSSKCGDNCANEARKHILPWNVRKPFWHTCIRLRVVQCCQLCQF